MRPELKLMEIIEKYLNNTLSTEDKQAFEQKLKNNADLQEKLAQQKALMQGLERFYTK